MRDRMWLNFEHFQNVCAALTNKITIELEAKS